MRVLIVCTHQTVVGGAETYLRDLIPALRRRGHAVAVLSAAAPHPAADPIHRPTADAPLWSLAADGPGPALAAAAGWRPDVAFQHGLPSPADEAAVLDRFPAVLFAHGHSGTCVSGTRAHSFPVVRPCDKRFGPACLVHYLPRRCGGRNPLSMLARYRAEGCRNQLLGRYAGVAVASRFMAAEYARHGVPNDRLHVAPLFPTGLPPDPHPPPPRPPTDRVAMAGRLYRLKGGRVLVDATAAAAGRLGRPLTVVVAGDGPERGGMAAAAARQGVPAEFHGWVGPDRRADLMRGADVVAVPSLSPETFGLVGVEGGAVGRPAVGFAVGGITDWLTPGETGELAPGDPPTAAGLADALVRALADPVRLHRLSVGAWEAAQRFTLDRHLDAVEPVLAAAAGRGQG